MAVHLAAARRVGALCGHLAPGASAVPLRSAHLAASPASAEDASGRPQASGDLGGQVVVVTGGAGGIGAQVARALARAGASVVLASRGAQALEALAAEINTLGAGRALAVPTDVTDPTQVEALVDRAQAHFGRLDVLVNNAGGALYLGAPEDMPAETWRRVVALNLDSVFFCSAAAARAMKRRGGGRIINISSTAGLTGPFQQHMVGYGASKAGVINLTQALASAWAQHGIAVNCIAPGVVATARMRSNGRVPAPASKEGARKSLLRLPPPPEKVADLVVFLASQAADHLSGSTLEISADLRLDWS